MYQTITFSSFADAFRLYGRSKQFTYEGLRHLYDYFEQLEEDTGEKIELDVIGICCEYAEEELSNVLKDYDLEDLEQLQDRTKVVNFDTKTGLVVYQQF